MSHFPSALSKPSVPSRCGPRRKTSVSLDVMRDRLSRAWQRRGWRKRLRRIAFIGVTMITLMSTLTVQTNAHVAIHHHMTAPARVELGAGVMAYATHALAGIANSAGQLIKSLLAGVSAPIEASTSQSPAGRPNPWQAAQPAAPFCTVNMGTGNVFTEVPVIGWESVGKPISFSFFHNTLGDEPGQISVLGGAKWRHSYSRQITGLLSFGPPDFYRFITDEGGSVLFEKEEAPVLKEPLPISPFSSFPSLPTFPLYTSYRAESGFYQYSELRRNNLTGALTLIYKDQSQDEFTSGGQLVRSIDASGNAIDFQYEMISPGIRGSLRLTTITDAALNTLTLQYDELTWRLIAVVAPPIGPPGEEIDRIYDVTYPTPNPGNDYAIEIAKASRDPQTNEPLYSARFDCTGDGLTTVNDYLDTSHTLSYDAAGRLHNVGLAVGSTIQQSVVFDFDAYALAPPTQIISFMHPHYSVVGTATMDSPRAGADLHTYRFDTLGRLTEVVDPMNRQVNRTQWYVEAYLPQSSTNVLDGVTNYTYDLTDGNLLSMQTPTQGSWVYDYDELNNRTYVKDPMNVETVIEYGDPDNPTQPTFIDGPGVSDMSLVWGVGHDGEDPPNPTYDAGKLLKTVSPNGIEQAFSYYNTPLGSNQASMGGLGQLRSRTHGRADFGGAPAVAALSSGRATAVAGGGGSSPNGVSDGVYMSDATGNTHGSTPAGTFRDCEVSLVLCIIDNLQPHDTSHCTTEGSGNFDCFNPHGDGCEVEFDADGNSGPCQQNCGSAVAQASEGGEGGPTPVGVGPSPLVAAYNGAGQPLVVLQPRYGVFGTTSQEFYSGFDYYAFEYDELGRRISKTATSQQPTVGPHIHTFFDHSVTWDYNDASGIVTRVYARPEMPEHPTAELPITTITETDLAGRVTRITQNGAVTTYAYADSTSVPAITETKPDGTVSEYYVDAAGQTSKIVHKANGGAEVLAFEYTRDARGRVRQIDEYVTGGPTPNVTTYTYGDGHLTPADLDADSAKAIEPEKVYYSWFQALAPSSFQASDPNRLVKESRTGQNAYQKEYWYDAGGNRLAVRTSEWVETKPGAGDFVTSEITRYNYAYKAHTDGDPRLNSGEPLPNLASSDQPKSRNTYGQGDRLGQDKLLSYKTYRFDLGTGQYDDVVRYTAYEYREENGKMSLRKSWDGESLTETETVFTYKKDSIETITIDETAWPADPGAFPEHYDTDRMVETYAYNVFGERIGVMHCTSNSLTIALPMHVSGKEVVGYCKNNVRFYDYVDGRVLVEREGGDFATQERHISSYNWGVMGLVARRGVSVRDGSYDPVAREFTDTEPPNPMCDYTYMADHMGNVAALVNSQTNTAQRQVFDSFGNNLSGFITFRCESDFDRGEWTDYRLCTNVFPPEYMNCDDPDAIDCDPPCPPVEELPDAAPVARMQTGGFNWRGGEGSITDRAAEEQRDIDSDNLRGEVLHAAYTRASTGLIYMQARYYEPETGRFTQADPLSYDPMQFIIGQNNRWNYCSNDSVNCSDPSGQISILLAGAILFFIGMAVGALAAALGLRLSANALFSALTALIVAGLNFSSCAFKNIGVDPSARALLAGLVTLLGADALFLLSTPGLGVGSALVLGGIASFAAGFAVGNFLYQAFAFKQSNEGLEFRRKNEFDPTEGMPIYAFLREKYRDIGIPSESRGCVGNYLT